MQFLFTNVNITHPIHVSTTTHIGSQSLNQNNGCCQNFIQTIRTCLRSHAPLSQNHQAESTSLIYQLPEKLTFMDCISETKKLKSTFCKTFKVDLYTPKQVYQFYLSAKAATDWMASTVDIYFLTLLKVGSPRSRCWQVWFLLRPLSLACRCHLLAASSRDHFFSV